MSRPAYFRHQFEIDGTFDGGAYSASDLPLGTQYADRVAVVVTVVLAVRSRLSRAWLVG